MHKLVTDISQTIVAAKVDKDIERARLDTLFAHTRECISTLRSIVTPIKELVFIGEPAHGEIDTKGKTTARFNIKVVNQDYAIYVGSPNHCCIKTNCSRSYLNGTVELQEAITGIVDYVASELKEPILEAAKVYVKRSLLY